MWSNEWSIWKCQHRYDEEEKNNALHSGPDILLIIVLVPVNKQKIRIRFVSFWRTLYTEISWENGKCSVRSDLNSVRCKPQSDMHLICTYWRKSIFRTLLEFDNLITFSLPIRLSVQCKLKQSFLSFHSWFSFRELLNWMTKKKKRIFHIPHERKIHHRYNRNGQQCDGVRLIEEFQRNIIDRAFIARDEWIHRWYAAFLCIFTVNIIGKTLMQCLIVQLPFLLRHCVKFSSAYTSFRNMSIQFHCQFFCMNI